MRSSSSSRQKSLQAQAAAGAEEEYKVYARRWVVLATYALLSMMVAVLWISFAPIAKEVSKYLDDVGHTAVNMLAICFMILYPFGTIAGSYCTATYGLRGTVITGGALALLSAGIRYLAIVLYESDTYSADTAYAVLFVGQCFAGMAQPFFMNLPTMIADNWFSAEERDVATTAASLFNPLGNAVGQMLPTMFVYEQDSGDVRGLPTLLFYELIMCLVTFGAALIWFSDKPPTPPSRSTATKAKQYKQSTSSVQRLVNDAKTLSKDRNYLILLFAFSMGLGLFNALMTLIEQIVDPYGYSSDDAGVFGALLIVCGLVGAAFTGVMLEKTHAYRPVLKFGFAFACCSVVLLVFMLREDNFAALAASFSIMGACVLPLLPAVLENCAECTYPLSEDLSTGILFAGGNIIGMPITFGLEAMLGRKKSWGAAAPANLFILSTVAVALAALMFFEGEYKRLNAERNHIGTPLLDEDRSDMEYANTFESTNTSSSNHGAALHAAAGAQDFRR